MSPSVSAYKYGALVVDYCRYAPKQVLITSLLNVRNQKSESRDFQLILHEVLESVNHF